MVVMEMKCQLVFLTCLLGSISCDSHGVAKNMPPNITTESTETFIIYKSDTRVHLPCKAEGEPKPRYEWYKNGRMLNLTMPNIKQVSDADDGSISFEPITSLDQGYYQCAAVNKHGKALTKVIHLKRAVMGSSPPMDTIRMIEVEEGMSLRIQCNPPRSVPQLSITWALADSQEDPNPITIIPNERLQVDPTGALCFSHVLRSDMQGGMLYKCNAFNPVLDMTTGGSYTRISVTYNDSFPDPGLDFLPPHIMYSSSDIVTVLKGGHLSLRCIFSGRPVPSVTWESKVMPMNRYQVQSSGTELVIEKVEFSDQGTYSCQANNSVSSEDKTIYVRVESTPQFTDEPNSIITPSESDSTFTCRAVGVPMPSISWMVNGKRVNPSNPGHSMSVSADSSMLTVHSADPMVIQCNASNVHGYQFTNAILGSGVPKNFAGFFSVISLPILIMSFGIH